MTDKAALKLAFVVDRFGNRYGGAEAYGVELMRQLSRTCDITVFAREYDPACELALPFVSLQSWPGWPSWIRVLLFAYRAWRHTRRGFDIVHSHMNGWCADIDVVHVTPVRFNWKVRPMPWYRRLSSTLSLRVQTYLGLEALRVAPRPGHRTVAVSGLIAEQLRQAYGAGFLAPVIPPGVSRPVATSPQRREKTRHDLGWAADDQVCLLVARNPLRKGLPTALKALALLPDRFKLLVVGGNAATLDWVRKSGHENVMDRVRIVEETSDVDTYYEASDVYIHPTLNDSFGMAPLEAMSFDLPVVLSSSPWCGFAQYVVDGHEALVLSHPENAEELARGMQHLCDDASLRVRLIQGGRQVVDRHSWPQAASQYAALYQDVLAERQEASGLGR